LFYIKKAAKHDFIFGILTFAPISGLYALDLPFRDFDVLFIDYAEQPRSHHYFLQFVFSGGSEIIFPRALDKFSFS
jgi:hypothetical protein